MFLPEENTVKSPNELTLNNDSIFELFLANCRKKGECLHLTLMIRERGWGWGCGVRGTKSGGTRTQTQRQRDRVVVGVLFDSNKFSP